MSFIAFMTCEGASQHGGPLAHSTIVQYRNEVQTHVLQHHGLPPHARAVQAVFNSTAVQRVLMGAKKLLGAAKQRARPLALDELRTLVRALDRQSVRDAALRLTLLVAFFGAMRLGNLAPAAPIAKAADRTAMWASVANLDDCQVRDGALVVSLRYSKTNQYEQRLHCVCLPRLPGADNDLCPVRAEGELRALRASVGITGALPLAQYGRGAEDTWTFDRVVKYTQGLIASRDDTKHELGHLTGHSFRRGFVKFALESGMAPDRILCHGDWKRLETVMDYAAGATVQLGIAEAVAGSRAGRAPPLQ